MEHDNTILVRNELARDGVVFHYVPIDQITEDGNIITARVLMKEIEAISNSVDLCEVNIHGKRYRATNKTITTRAKDYIILTIDMRLENSFKN